MKESGVKDSNSIALVSKHAIHSPANWQKHSTVASLLLSITITVLAVRIVTGAFRIDAIDRQSDSDTDHTEIGQETVDRNDVVREHRSDILVRLVQHVHRQGHHDAQSLRADRHLLGDTVLGSHGRVDRAVDAGQRGIPQRVS